MRKTVPYFSLPLFPLLLWWSYFIWASYVPHRPRLFGRTFRALLDIPFPPVWKAWWFDWLVVWSLAFAALCVGGWLLSRCGLEMSGAERLLLATSGGFVALVLAASSLALFHQFRPGVLRALVAVFGLAAVIRVRAEARFLKKLILRAGGLLRAEPLAFVPLLLSGVFLFFGMVAAAAPETSFDALGVHLYYPRLFLEKGYFFLADLYRSNSPLYTQVLYSIGLVLHGQGLARFLNFLFYPACALAVFVFTRSLAAGATAAHQDTPEMHAAALAHPSRHDTDQNDPVGAPVATPANQNAPETTAGQPRSLMVALLAVLFFVSAPVALYHSSVCMPDLALAFYSFLALLAIVRLLKTNRMPWLALAGLFAGMAVGTKFAGLYSEVALGVVLAAGLSLRQRFREVFRRALIFASISLVLAAPWYLRNWYYTGDPLHPSFYKWISKPVIDPVEAKDLMADAMNYHRLPASPRNLLTLPWAVTMQGDRLEGTIGPIFLWALPLVLLGTRRDRIWMAALSAAVGESLLWFFGPQWQRYFLPVIPILACLSAVAVESSRWPVWMSRVWVALAVFFTLVNLPGMNPMWVGGGYNVLSEIPYRFAFGSESAEQFQRTRIDGFDTIQFLNGLALAPGTGILPAPLYESYPQALSRYPVIDIFEDIRISCQHLDGGLGDCYNLPADALRKKMDQHRIGVLAIRRNPEWLPGMFQLSLESSFLRSDFRFLEYASGAFLFRRRQPGEAVTGRYVNVDLLERWVLKRQVRSQDPARVHVDFQVPIGWEKRLSVILLPPNEIRYEVSMVERPYLSFSLGTNYSAAAFVQGTELTVLVRPKGGEERAVFSHRYMREDVEKGWQAFSVDLSDYSGQDAELILRTAALQPNGQDWLAIADPVIYAAENTATIP